MDKRNVHIYMDEILWQKLRRFCFDNETSMSAMIVRLVKEFIEKEEKKTSPKP